MTHPPEPESMGDSRWFSRLWGAVLVLLCGWAAFRMGAFDLSTRVVIEGRTVDVINTFAEVDHPFHSTRAATLLESLRDGEILRWIGSHQGGYPVEFYPLGIAWLDVLIWALSFGSVSILAAHKLAVILVFLLPAWSYWLLARGDRLHPAVAVLATAVHFAVPGHWLNGGYEELVGWGLVTNVAGGSLALLTSAALARFVLNREFGMGVLATLAAAAGAMTNPRSLFAVVVAAIAILIVALVTGREGDSRTRLIDPLVRIGAVGGIAVLLAAPVVFSLFRYNSLYFFLHYEFYEPISEYWDASEMAVTRAVLLLAIAGVIVCRLPRLGVRLDISRCIAVAGIGYALLTLWVATASVVPPLVEQLEAPRLMPFQRQVLIWLGTMTVAVLVQRIAGVVGTWSSRLLPPVVLAGTALLFLVAHVEPWAAVPEEEVAFREATTTGNSDHASFVSAIELAESVRPQGTSMFVVGNRDDWWHQQLWAPAYSGARFFYDDWLWYWHADHPGPYDPANGYWFPNPTDALQSDYLDTIGAGVVVVSDMWVPSGVPPRQSARENPRLSYVGSSGAWDVYTVNEPTTLVSNGDDQPESIELDNHEITASFADGNGTIVIRQNWFPRWTATVNGEPVEITRRDDGFMQLDAPAGAADVRLEYAVTKLDWTARMASIVGGILLLTGVWKGREVLDRLELRPDESSGTATRADDEGLPAQNGTLA